MKRLLLIAAGVLGGALLAARVARQCGGLDFEKRIERMPEGARPKWMFRNISAIRTNSERILELLEAERTPAEVRQPPVAA
jgi:hypothetical protein